MRVSLNTEVEEEEGGEEWSGVEWRGGGRGHREGNVVIIVVPENRLK